MFCLFIYLFLSFLFMAASPANQDVPLQVNGLQKQSVCLKIYLDLTVPVLEVLWLFKTKEKNVRLAYFRKPHFEIRILQFHNRLEPLDSGTTLRISDLRMEDSGIYTAAITYTDEETKRLTFNLTVYEPVPTPDIKMEMEQISPDWCNFTLHCSAPTNPSALSYSWMYRHKGRYQPYPNGTTIRVSLQPESWDGEYLCLVQNPADQNNASIAPREFCPHTSLTKGINGGYNSRAMLVSYL
ncbi:SLAM family member 5-like [Xenopus tropicalis]|uniref:SLAM family member 5-like n=1 Tax=Xenopus tropicalis TaxID=8364 RepID=A0A803JE40_XENTR|nr:SLAM family member 5-like [Xenopus tropicalis]